MFEYSCSLCFNPALNYGSAPDYLKGVFLIDCKVGKSNTFLNCLEDNFIFQKLDEGTRGSAVLDLMFTKREDLTKKVKVTGTLGESNHIILEFLNSRERKAESNQICTLDFRKADFIGLSEQISRSMAVKGGNGPRGLGFF